MIRLLQIVLGFVIFYFLYLAIVSTAVVLPMMIKRAEKGPTALKGVTYSLRQESFFISPSDLKFAKVYRYDSTRRDGELQTYIEALNFKPDILVNDTPFAKNRKGELIKLGHNDESGALQVPISLTQFNRASFSFITIMIAYLIFVIFLAYHLFQFARLAGQKEFFVKRNRRRLRLLGAYLIVNAFIVYFLESSRQWILESLTGTWGYHDTGTTPFVGFPSMFIAGILMFIIAEAFARGQQLQTEQEYTI